jgi:hypothetical protein
MRFPWYAGLLVLLLVLVLPCAGLAGGYALARAEWRGVFARWQRLPTPPSPARQILAGGTRLSTGGWWLYTTPCSRTAAFGSGSTWSAA